MEIGAVVCGDCGTEVPPHLKDCLGCEKDAGFPNVRAADSAVERDALEKRYQSALVSARAQGTTAILNDFEEAIAASKCVVTFPFLKLLGLLKSGNTLSVSFHKQVASESRIPENNPYDRARPIIEETLFRNYKSEMQYGLLSLDGKGSEQYGGAAVTFQTNMINSRTTAFEENSYTFCIVKHKMAMGASLPLGFRASWDRRATLAAAKLHLKLVAGTTPEAYPGVLLSHEKESKDDDFIELHIYGNLHQVAVEQILAKRPRSKADRLQWLAVKDEAKNQGIPFETPS